MRGVPERFGVPQRAGLRRLSGIDRRTGCPPPPPDLRKAKPHQIEAIRFLRSRDRALLADDMGSGKTFSVLRALEPRPRAIVLSTASAAVTWEAECARWRPDLSAVSDVLRIPDRGEVVVASYDTILQTPVRELGRVLDGMTRDVVLTADECHLGKNGDALRSRQLRVLSAQCGRIWGLTGTPMVGTPKDLWGTLESLGLTAELGVSRREFLKLFSDDDVEVSPAVRELLSPVMLRRLRSEILRLPSVKRKRIQVKAPDDLRSYLDRFKESWDFVDPNELPPFHLLSEARAALARSRIWEAIRWIENDAPMPLLVFSAHLDPILAVGRLNGAVTVTGASSLKERREAVGKFKRGDARIFAATIEAGGASLNLAEAAAVLFVDRDYTPGRNDQAEARAVRQGQRHDHVLIAYMVTDHPVDVRLQEILDVKEARIRGAVG